MDIILTKQTLILDIPYDQSKYSVLLSSHPVLVNRKRLHRRSDFWAEASRLGGAGAGCCRDRGLVYRPGVKEHLGHLRGDRKEQKQTLRGATA